jgi:hypothetical protein
MPTTAQWGIFEWGEAEWGSIESEDAWEATGRFSANNVAELTTSIALAALCTFTMANAAALTTQITLAATGAFTLVGTGELTFTAAAAALARCGHPIYSIDGWPDQPC